MVAINCKSHMATRIGKIHCLKMLVFLIVIIFLIDTTMAQNPGTTPQVKPAEKTENEIALENANLKKALAEADKATAEASKAAAEARKAESELDLPTSETKGLPGTVTVGEGVGYFAEILAYTSMNNCAMDIAAKLKGKLTPKDHLIILGQADLGEEAALWNLLKIKTDAVFQTLDQSIALYENYNIDRNESVLAILAAAPAILGAAAEIAGFFKVNRTLSNRAVAVNEQALFSAVANEIHNTDQTITIILPKCNLSGDGEIQKKIWEILGKRDSLITIKEKLNQKFNEVIQKQAETLKKLEAKKAVLNKKIDKAIADGSSTTILEKELLNIELGIGNATAYERDKTAIMARLDKEVAATDALITVITEKPADKPSVLESIAVIEQIKSEPKAKLLYVLTVSQGGEVETSQATFSQGRISYIGGVVVSFILTESNGKYIASGNEQKVKQASFKRKEGPGNLENSYLNQKPLQ
jgi:hypothetical protein